MYIFFLNATKLHLKNSVFIKILIWCTHLFIQGSLDWGIQTYGKRIIPSKVGES